MGYDYIWLKFPCLEIIRSDFTSVEIESDLFELYAQFQFWQMLGLKKKHSAAFERSIRWV